MDVYIGVKMIRATPMTAGEFVKDHPQFKSVLSNHSPEAAGYLVQYPDGYTSWSPKECFEQAYRKVSDKELNLMLSR